MVMMQLIEELIHWKPHNLFYLGGIILLSLTAAYLANRMKAPRVTGYLLIGLALGPYALGVFDKHLIEHEFDIIRDIALAIIAFAIGASMDMKEIRRLGKSIEVITLTQSIGTLIFTTLAIWGLLLLLFPYYPAMKVSSMAALGAALIMGGIAVATAPAAVMAIISEYKSEGKLTSIVLGIVALDDALTLIVFALISGLAPYLMGTPTNGYIGVILEPAYHILGALLLGMLAAYLLKYVLTHFINSYTRMGISIGMIFLVAGLSLSMHLSELLALMTFGFFIVNIMDEAQFGIVKTVKRLEETVFAMFFFIAGAHLNLTSLATGGFGAIVLTLSRFGGKALGSYLGGKALGLKDKLTKNIGLTLLPQAGVAIALVFDAANLMPNEKLADFLIATVLSSIIINELITPFIARFALQQTGDIDSQPHD